MRIGLENAGKKREQPYSGSLTLRMPPDLHRRLAEAAARSGNKSLNSFYQRHLGQAAI